MEGDVTKKKGGFLRRGEWGLRLVFGGGWGRCIGW